MKILYNQYLCKNPSCMKYFCPYSVHEDFYLQYYQGQAEATFDIGCKKEQFSLNPISTQMNGGKGTINAKKLRAYTSFYTLLK